MLKNMGMAVNPSLFFLKLSQKITVCIERVILVYLHGMKQLLKLHILLIFLSVSSSVSYGQCINCTNSIPLNNNLVACFPFSGNANDETSNGNNGTAFTNATLTTDRNSETSKAYSFNGGSTAYIRVAASASLNTATMTAFSYSCWFNPAVFSPSAPTAYRRIFNIQDATGKNYDLSYHYATGKLDFINFSGTADHINFFSNTTFSPNTWYHVVVTIDAANHPSLYVNGILDNSSSTTVLKPSSPVYTIGNHFSFSWNFAGKIDDVRIYNRALSLSEISQLYSSLNNNLPAVTSIPDRNICLGDSTQLTALAGNPTYSWSPSTGLSNPNISNPFAKPTADQEYVVTISNATCSTTDTVMVTVNTNCCFSCTTPAAINGSLVACYPFNGNANDESGNNNHGTTVGATLTTDRNGAPNKAMYFNGSSYINVPNSVSLQSPSTAITLSTWIYINSWYFTGGTNYAPVLCKSASASSTQYRFTITQTSMDLIFAGNQTITYTASSFSLNTWYHVVATSVSGVVKFYINGSLVLGASATGTFPANSTVALDIGRDLAGSTDFFTGKIDDIRIYNRALAASEIGELYIGKEPPAIIPITDKTICQGDSVQLILNGGTSYTWAPSTGLSNPNIFNPYAKPTDTTQYVVTVFNGTCSAKDTVNVNIKKTVVDAGANQNICFRDSIQLQATGSVGATYVWTPSTTLSNGSIANPYAKPADTSLYKVTATLNGCSVKDSVTINVKKVLADAGANTAICIGDSIHLNATGGTSYAWKQHVSLSDSSLQNPYAKPTDTTKYFVTVKDGFCSNIDSVTIFVATLTSLNAGTDKTICQGDSAQLTATGGTTYLWNASTSLSNVNIANPYAKPSDTTKYYVTISNSLCSTTDSVTVNVKKVIVDAGVNQNICFRDSIQLQATGSVGATYVWTPPASLSNPIIANPYAKPSDTTLYKVTATLNGCSSKDSVTINVKKVIADAGPNSSICINDSIQLNATGGTSYAWKQNVTLSDTTIRTPYAKPTVTTKYFVTVKNGLCSNTDSVTITIATILNVNAGVDTSICLGDSIRLLATGASSYAWSSATTLSNTAIANPYAKPSDTTMYYVTGFSGSCSAMDSVKVNVKKPLIDAGLTQTICYLDSIQLHATGSAGSTYTWTPVASLNNALIANPYAKPADTTMYRVTGLSNGCTVIDSVKVNVRRVIADAGANTSVCQGDSVQLNASGGISFTWQTNATLSSTVIPNPFAKPVANITYYVTVNDGTCSARDSVKVILNNTNTLDAGLDTEVCLHDSVQLQAIGATTYTWTPAVGLSNNTISNPKASPVLPTDYIVRGLAGLCYDTDTIRVSIKPLPVVDLGIDTFICFNETHTFYPTVTNADVYNWQPALLLDDATIKNPTTLLNSAQTFTLTATNTTTGCTNSDQVLVSIQKPTAQFTLDDSASASPPLIVTPTNTSFPLPLLYDWEMQDTITTYYTDAEPTHSFASVGVYKILLTVTDDRGCTDTISRFVSITREGKIFIPNVFTPNGNGLNDVFEISFIPGTILEMKGSIWNRWGEKIYAFGSPSYIWWNGQASGQDVSDGVYYYTLDVVDLNGKAQQFHGTVTLLR